MRYNNYIESAARLAVFLIIALAAPTSRADEAPVVDFNDREQMAEVAKKNPEQFLKVGKILNGLFKSRKDTIPKWIRTTFDAKEVMYSDGILLVSYPPKVRLSFVLGETQYEGLVTLYEPFRVTPTKSDRTWLRMSPR